MPRSEVKKPTATKPVAVHKTQPKPTGALMYTTVKVWSEWLFRLSTASPWDCSELAEALMETVFVRSKKRPAAELKSGDIELDYSQFAMHTKRVQGILNELKEHFSNYRHRLDDCECFNIECELYGALLEAMAEIGSAMKVVQKPSRKG